jgi:hypothetical protein
MPKGVGYGNKSLGKTASPPAKGNGMSPEKVGSNPSMTSDMQSARMPKGHGIKGLGNKRVTSGY